MGKLDRKTKRNFVVLVIVPIVVTAVGLTTFGIVNKQVELRNLYAQGEIVILKDKDFSKRHSLPGSGVKDDPYRIENRVFVEHNKLAIVIKDTTKHFVIRNCTIRNNGQPVLISNIEYNTGRINNNTFICDQTYNEDLKFDDTREKVGLLDYCIYYPYLEIGFTFIANAPGIRIENNLVLSNYEKINHENAGFQMISCDYSVISNNSISFFRYGISVSSSLYVNIQKNHFTNNSVAIHLDEIKESTILNNNCLNSTYGIQIYWIEKVLILGNNLSNNYEGLTSFYKTSFCQLKNNFVQENVYGFAGEFDNCNITNNYFSSNLLYGVRLDKYDCYQNNIHHNVFLENNQEGLLDDEKQAYDGETNHPTENLWYEVLAQAGNYWSDLTWDEDSIYVMAGGNATDYYPLEQQPSLELWGNV